MFHPTTRTVVGIALLLSLLVQSVAAVGAPQPVAPQDAGDDREFYTTDGFAADRPAGTPVDRLSVSATMVSADIGDAATGTVSEQVERIKHLQDLRYFDTGGGLDAPGITFPPALLVATGYSRSVTEEPLRHETRRTIFEHIHANPGIARSTLADVSGTTTSTIRYHVDILESANLVEVRTVLGQVRLAETGVPRAHVELRASLADSGTAPVLAGVARLDNPSVTTLAAELDRTPSTVSYHVNRLVDADVLERERNGRSVALRLSEHASEVPIGVALSNVDTETG